MHHKYKPNPNGIKRNIKFLNALSQRGAGAVHETGRPPTPAVPPSANRRRAVTSRTRRALGVRRWTRHPTAR